jgi:serine phosphatase RsbU (regulator of sigma subunit)
VSAETVEPFASITTPDEVLKRVLLLSESLTTAADLQQVADRVCSFLTDNFQGRALVTLRGGDDSVVTAMCAFDEDNASRRTPDLARLSVPLRAGPQGLTVGQMHVGWPTERAITESMTALAETASSVIGHVLARLSGSHAAHDLEFREALDAMLDDVAVGRAVRSDNGEIVDFVIEFVNNHSTGARRSTDGLVGQLICDVHPDWRASGMFDRFRAVVETGVAYHGHKVQHADPPSSTKDDTEGKRRQSYRTLQVVKFGDGYISASRDVTEVVLAEEASRSAAAVIAAEHAAIGLLQAAALPRTMPALVGVRIAAVYEPADARQPVGGDWYDVFAVDENRVALIIADVAGHGHSAAVFMVQVRNIFRAIAAEHTEPDDVLTRANDVTTRLNEPDGPFVTCCFAMLDIRARTLRWAQAGHFSPLVVSPDGTSRYLDARSGAPLAFFEDERYESSTVDVRAGDRVLMFTDGLIERRREILDVGLDRLATLASVHAHLPAQEFVDTLAASVTERFDDLALVCVDFVGL